MFEYAVHSKYTYNKLNWSDYKIACYKMDDTTYILALTRLRLYKQTISYTDVLNDNVYGACVKSRLLVLFTCCESLMISCNNTLQLSENKARWDTPVFLHIALFPLFTKLVAKILCHVWCTEVRLLDMRFCSSVNLRWKERVLLILIIIIMSIIIDLF